MATVKGEVINGDTGDRLQGAAVQIVNKEGASLGPGVAAGSDGRFTLTSGILPGNYLVISYTGLVSVMMPASMLNDSRFTEIVLYSKVLDPVIVTPRKGSSLWWLLFGIAAVAGANKLNASRPKKRKRYAFNKR